LVTNVRELENVIRSASLSVCGAVIDAPDLAVSVSDQPVEAQLIDLLGLDFTSQSASSKSSCLKQRSKKARGNRGRGSPSAQHPSTAPVRKLERAPAVGSGTGVEGRPISFGESLALRAWIVPASALNIASDCK
jgi:DNA-binding NtrC family response regulator